MIDVIQKKELKRASKIVKSINKLEKSISRLSDKEFPQKTAEFKEKLSNGCSLEDIQAEAYAVAREASKRVLGMRHFDVQLIGGIVLNNGDIAEMRTGEGKTLVATTAAYLNALTGKGVHVVTVNDYLAERDSELMSPLYTFLGLTTGCITNKSTTAERRDAYACDITYGTNSEFGFDYLKDNMVMDLKDKVQRGLNYAIIDEVDSILIDEARTPLIISGAAQGDVEDYKKADSFIKSLKKKDYEIKEKEKQISLTDSGVTKAENYFGLSNLADPANIELNHFIMQALRANYIMKKNGDYIVADGEIKIVDEFTGRIMEGRRFSDGLHQAIEAKENVAIKPESKTYATITLQNYFRMYHKLSGMTGTAKNEAEEFNSIYNMNVVTIPTNKPVKRIDRPDQIYFTEDEKLIAAANRAKEIHDTGRPVLIGTTSVENSEKMHMLLKQNGVPHTVLNAKNHSEEAAIIAQAGRIGAVTVATNMAGRGTDILLGGNPDMEIQNLHDMSDYEMGIRSFVIKNNAEKEKQKVKSLGGLYIIGTERHESKRIDDQLRGRAGRQGDPGETEFFVSLEDPLMRRFDKDRIDKLLKKAKRHPYKPIKSETLEKMFESVQKRVEGNNYGIRKNILQYDNVMDVQRKVIYKQRNAILAGKDGMNEVLNSFIGKIVAKYVDEITEDKKYPEMWNLNELSGRLYEEIGEWIDFKNAYGSSLEDLTADELKSDLINAVKIAFANRERLVGEQVFTQTEKMILLKVIDSLWIDYLDAVDQLKQGIGLRALGQKDPAIEFAKIAREMFGELIDNIESETVRYCARIQPDVVENAA